MRGGGRARGGGNAWGGTDNAANRFNEVVLTKIQNHFEKAFARTLTQDYSFSKGGSKQEPPIEWLDVRRTSDNKLIGVYRNKNPRSAAWESVTEGEFGSGLECLWAGSS